MVMSSKKEKIYSLRLDIKNPDIPFTVEKSICTESGDLIQVFSGFQLELVKLMRQLHQEELDERGPNPAFNDDIPF